jgi:hypothetical protein
MPTPPTRASLGALLFPSPAATTRIRHLLERVEAVGPLAYPGQSWLLAAADHVLRQVGIDLRASNYLSIEDILERRGAAIDEGSAVSLLLAGAWYALHNQVDERGRTEFARPDEYEQLLNQILAEEGCGFRLREGGWIVSSVSDAELLRRILLENADEAVACKQGDVQVEMVVSTVQTKLAAAGAVVVDYGAGVGRVLAGLATAENFKKAHYIAVDEPMPDAVKRLAGRTGAKSDFIESRAAFLAGTVTADAIMVVNTLHHVPFREIAVQITGLLAKLRPGGFLLVHEMGALRAPEQLNVPWRVENLIRLFQGSEFTCNARSTMSKSGVPLCHAIVTTTGNGNVGGALTGNVGAVWDQMKTRALDEIAALYASGDSQRHADLQHELITNANLDLNRP